MVVAGVLQLSHDDQQSNTMSHVVQVTSVHLTGSASTYDAIVWQGHPKRGEPPFNKSVGAELGNVSPCIVVPGPWSAADMVRGCADPLAQSVLHQHIESQINSRGGSTSGCMEISAPSITCLPIGGCMHRNTMLTTSSPGWRTTLVTTA